MHLLDTVLLWIAASWITFRDAVTGIHIFGEPGSGKTSGSGETLARAFLRFGLGGMVLCCKSDEAERWRQYCKEEGRSHQHIEVSVDGAFRYNWLDVEYQRGAGIENIARLFTTVLGAQSGNQAQQSQGDQKYWDDTRLQLIRSCSTLCAAAYDRITLPLLYDIVISLPQHSDDLGDQKWRDGSAAFAAIRQGTELVQGTRMARDFDLSCAYVLKEFPVISDRTRSIIVSTFTSLCDGMMRGDMHDLFGTGTDFVMEHAIEHGAIIVLNLPLKTHHDVGRIAQTLLKTIFQRQVQSRIVTDASPVCFLFADEAQNFLTGQDKDFLDTARSSRCATVFLSQNINNYYGLFPTINGRALVQSILANFGVKCWHANGCVETNKYASETISRNLIHRQRGGTIYSSNPIMTRRTRRAIQPPRRVRDRNGCGSLAARVLFRAAHRRPRQ